MTIVGYLWIPQFHNIIVATLMNFGDFTNHYASSAKTNMYMLWSFKPSGKLATVGWYVLYVLCNYSALWGNAIVQEKHHTGWNPSGRKLFTMVDWNRHSNRLIKSLCNARILIWFMYQGTTTKVTRFDNSSLMNPPKPTVATSTNCTLSHFNSWMIGQLLWWMVV